jgi:hypothetical protein
VYKSPKALVALKEYYRLFTVDRNFAKLFDAADDILNNDSSHYNITGKSKYRHVYQAKDHHDFVSISPWHWPNPVDPKGPFSYDPEKGRNPLADEVDDGDILRSMIRDVDMLAFAYYLSDNAAYASHVISILKTFFINPTTRMNPHMESSRIVFQSTSDSVTLFTGAAEFIGLPLLLDALAMLENAPEFEDDDREALSDWFLAYLTWLTSSAKAKTAMISDTTKAPFSMMALHMEAYDIQVLSLALFFDQAKLAQETAHRAMERLRVQLSGVENEVYFNLSSQALFAYARLGSILERTDIDIWSVTGDSGFSLKTAVDTQVQLITHQLNMQQNDAVEREVFFLLPVLVDFYHRFPVSEWKHFIVSAASKLDWFSSQYKQQLYRIGVTLSESTGHDKKVEIDVMSTT